MNIDELEKPQTEKEIRPTGISESKNGYWITKSIRGNGNKTFKISNWTGIVEAIIVRSEDERDRKITIKHECHVVVAYMQSSVLTSASKFREFLLNNCNFTALFFGNDNDLQSLVEYWGKQESPVIVKETECVGEIPEGFIAENVFIGLDGNTKKIKEGLAYLSPKSALQVAKFVTRGGKIAGMPAFKIDEPHGGIEKFKNKVFDLMVKNRNLKVAIALGWTKATLWSNMFWERKKWFPSLMTHGRKECGKSVLATWLLAILGMHDVPEISIRKSQYEAGSERAISYYSSLPVHFCDYRNTENEGQKFHALFRNIFDRSSVVKGKRNSPLEVRQVVVRGCLLLDGENAISDAGLNSRFITFEMTEDERVEKYYKNIVEIESELSHIGYDWIKNRVKGFEEFFKTYNEILPALKKGIPSNRQAQCWAVALAGALTEPYFAAQREGLIEYVVNLANHEIKEQKSEELIGSLWEAAECLKHINKLPKDVIEYAWLDNTLKIKLSVLLGVISGEKETSRKYDKLNKASAREIAKLLKQETYVLGAKTIRMGELQKETWGWIIDMTSEKLPETLKNMYLEETKTEDYSID